jgi:alpha-1,6-mannosyltransferase
VSAYSSYIHHRAKLLRSKALSAFFYAALMLLAAGLALIFIHISRESNLNERVPEFILLILLAGALYLAAVWLIERFTENRAALLIILAAAVFYRIILLPARPSLSEDLYRYQWEGRVQALSLNPYIVYPAEPGVQKLQNPAHPLRTGSQTPTVYPPFSEIAFSWVHTIPGYKRLFTGLDLATLAILLWILILLEQPLHRVLIYAWNPAVIVSFSLCGHHDSLAIFTLMLAHLFIISRKSLLSNALLGLSFASKFFAVLFLPLFLRRTKWLYAAAFAGVVALAYLPFLSAGRQLFRGLSDYAAGWEGNDSLFRIIRLASASKAQAEFVAAVLVLGLILYAIRSKMPLFRAGLFLTAGLLLLSPNAFPWYFTWTVPFLCFEPSAPWLLMTVTCVLGYSPVVAYAAGRPYRNSPLMLALEYIPVIAWLAWQGWRALQKPSSVAASTRPNYL